MEYVPFPVGVAVGEVLFPAPVVFPSLVVVPVPAEDPVLVPTPTQYE